jgi:hypothetical protein
LKKIKVIEGGDARAESIYGFTAYLTEIQRGEENEKVRSVRNLVVADRRARRVRRADAVACSTDCCAGSGNQSSRAD